LLPGAAEAAAAEEGRGKGVCKDDLEEAIADAVEAPAAAAAVGRHHAPHDARPGALLLRPHLHGRFVQAHVYVAARPTHVAVGQRRHGGGVRGRAQEKGLRHHAPVQVAHPVHQHHRCLSRLRRYWIHRHHRNKLNCL
jgi:hypothetical protein